MVEVRDGQVLRGNTSAPPTADSIPPPLFLLLLGLLPAGPVASRPRIGLHGSAPSGGGISSRGRGTSVRGFQAVKQGVKLHKL